MGTRLQIRLFELIYQDHPHACGDKLGFAPVISSIGGSSPRVWGQGQGIAFIISLPRIIPTRVGTSMEEIRAYIGDRDHPHACGDKEFGMPSCVKASGSSPRVWGQGATMGNTTYSNRIIPTRVGTSGLVFGNTNNDRDHPHACGDKLIISMSQGGCRGSSPRVWGQAKGLPLLQPTNRIIPTRVGTSHYW